MKLTQILVLTAFAGLIGTIIPRRWRTGLLLAGSLVAVFWLQPSTPIRNLDFWLPAAAISLTIYVWALTTPSDKINPRGLLVTSGIVIGILLAIGFTRYFDPLCCLAPSRPPHIWQILVAVVLVSLACGLPLLFPRARRHLATFTIILILAIFIILKTEPLARGASGLLRSLAGQSANLASALDLPWLGFSYLAFRLLHVLRDYQAGKLPALSLEGFIAYTLFFPAYTAGPIDRAQRFAKDFENLSQPQEEPPGSETPLSSREIAIKNLIRGSERIIIGLFKKFVLADSLAVLALSTQNASQVTSGFWAWVLLYGYSLRIYLDFSGYTDIAIGIGNLLGFSLPENFERPYLKQNLTAFWNSWHITLAQWFRAYFFYPLTRALRSRAVKLPAWSIILIGQVATMVLIGLWHGLSWNFLIWGAWHGVGLFLHNRWTDWRRPREADVKRSPRVDRLVSLSSWLVTFNYVTLGWVWFALPDPGAALNIFRKLFGFA